MELLGSPSDHNHNRAQHSLVRGIGATSHWVGRTIESDTPEQLHCRVRPNDAGLYA